MNVDEFRNKVKPDSVLVIEGAEHKIQTLIKFKFDDGSFYMKCYLFDGSVFADDDTENIFVFCQPIEPFVNEPFPEKIVYDEKDFDFTYQAHAIAEEISNEKHFLLGEGETFWDYQARDGSYLSLGKFDNNNERSDYAGKIIHPNNVQLIL